MKKSDAKPGTKVLATWAGAFEEYSEEEIVTYQYNDGDYGELVGVIRSKEASPGHVWVKWIDGDGLDSIDAGEDNEMEVDLKILTLASEKSDIEKDFKDVSKAIKEKMKEAGKLVLEANAMAKQAHLGSLANLYDAARPLVNAMDDSGWRSSSWGC